MNQHIITTKQAAEILGVSPCRVRQFVDDGRLTPLNMYAGVQVFDRHHVVKLSKVPRKPGQPKKL